MRLSSVKFVAVALTLLALVGGIAIVAAAPSNDSLNKDHRTVQPPTAPQAAPVLGIIVDHSDLPTRFGDEDDVIESKGSSDKKSADHNGNSSKKGKLILSINCLECRC